MVENINLYSLEVSLITTLKDLELILNMLAEAATKDIANTKHPRGLEENKKVAKRGGSIAGNARKEIEQETGKPVITSKNSIDLGKLIGVVAKEIENEEEKK